MRYAKIKDGIVIDVITGHAPSDYKVVLKKWFKPKNYPGLFYLSDSNKPRITIVEDELHENWNFTLKPIKLIKSHILDELEKIRSKRQKEPFTVDGQEVVLKNNNDVNNIASLSNTANSYKIKKGRWITSPAKIILLKKATSDHVQGTYDWELEQIELVESMVTVDELKDYFESL